jgi:hypothetical protein
MTRRPSDPDISISLVGAHGARSTRSKASRRSIMLLQVLTPRPVRSLISWTRLGGGLPCILLHPFPAAQNPGCEHVGQALRFCLSDLVIMKHVPARTQPSARDFGLDLGEQTLNAKGAGLHEVREIIKAWLSDHNFDAVGNARRSLSELMQKRSPSLRG